MAFILSYSMELYVFFPQSSKMYTKVLLWDVLGSSVECHFNDKRMLNILKLFKLIRSPEYREIMRYVIQLDTVMDNTMVIKTN